MASYGKANPFLGGLSEKPPLVEPVNQKMFIRIPLSTGVQKKDVSCNTLSDNLCMNTADSAMTDGDSVKSTEANHNENGNITTPPEAKRSGYTRIDNFIFDVLIRKINSTPASVLYFYLWRKSLGYQKSSVSLSHKTLAESIGISKRTVQNAIVKLNKLNIILTKQAHKTAIPEHFMIRFWEAKKTKIISENTAMADFAIAENDSINSTDNTEAVVKYATIKKNIINKKINSLHRKTDHSSWKEFISKLTHRERERANKILKSLATQFPDDSIEEIAECPKNMQRFGAPDGTLWSNINSPIGLMESSWPRLRDFFREQHSNADRSKISYKKNEEKRINLAITDETSMKEQRNMEKLFFKIFPTEKERKKTMIRYNENSPFDINGLLGKRVAIERWFEDFNKKQISDK